MPSRNIKKIKSAFASFIKLVTLTSFVVSQSFLSGLLLNRNISLNEGTWIAQAAEVSSPTLTTYVVPAITDTKILPKSSVDASYKSSTISAQVSPGEYKAVSFVVNSDQAIDALQVEASDLTGSGKTISKTAVDIKAVKCWYQGGYNKSISVTGRYLTPELLLKDDSLVKVGGDDWAKWNTSNPSGKNYLKVNGSYTDISGDTQQKSMKIVPISERPIQDSSVLHPVELPANYNKQFWITLHIPNDAKSGDYSGTISLKSGTTALKSLALKVVVLPITLPAPNVEYSSYYHGMINGSGSISSEDKTVEQYTAEHKDMLAHGVTNPIIYQWLTDERLLQELSIRRQVGMDNTNIYTTKGLSADTGASLVPHYTKIAAPYGVKTFYKYGPDETNLNTPERRKIIADIHAAGGKYFNSQCTVKNRPSCTATAESVADILDIAVVSFQPSSDLAALYHSYGHKVYSYANPQAVPEYPRLFRMNYGLTLWQADYDGAMDFSYQFSMGDIWNDFDNASRDHIFAYPTANGVIDTVQWEGFREGMNDMRYLAALQKEIAATDSRNITAIEAKNYLSDLKKTDLQTQDLDAVRARMVGYILVLQSLPHPLSVSQGTGSGSYTQGAKVNIVADSSVSKKVFDKWTGDVQYVSDVNSASAFVTMPAGVVSLTATYKDSPVPDDDNTSPSISSITTTLPSGNYATGTAIPITINFSKAVTGSGITITFNTTPARTCAFSVNNTASASCIYTIQAGDSASILDGTVSGTIHDQSGRAMTNFTPASSLSGSKTIVINSSTNSSTDPTTPTTPSAASSTGTYSTGTLFKISSSPKVYVIKDGKKKWISTPEVFEQLGYQWTDIKVISETELNNLSDYEDNLIRQAGDYKVYLVVDGVKRHIPNPEVFLDYGFNWNDVKEVDSTTSQKYRDTYLIKESKQTQIYYVNKRGIRKLIPTTEIFNSYNDKQEDIQIVSKKEMENHPLSNLIKPDNGNDIYFIENNVKKRIPNPQVFNQHGFDWNYICSVNQTEFDWYQTGETLR